MDAIWLMVLLFLNGNALCEADPATLTKLGGQTYQVLQWTCGDKQFQVWQRWCPMNDPPGVEPSPPRGYWSRPYYLEETRSGHGFYLNRFAEIHAGIHIDVEEIYRPPCGV